MKKTSLHYSKYWIIFPLIIVLLFFLYFFSKKDSRIPPALIPSQTEQYLNERDQSCPILKLSTENLLNPNSSFEIVNVYCDYDSETKLGYDYIDVEILTPNSTSGTQEFKDWLSTHGLQESDTLRVNFIHKPQ